ncbi:SRPBCC domain-containing protein [Chryseobacterium nematophagum]|uniref:SRPBCC domain-containing protein n=1 Tax=Chryseobacterium nematophagum TaxID=2305228 RepID=A0A3M7LAE9_9FLAO|nr:SRPBCC domain-containing protein [Chryseobacterium nematophagum]RMZ59728.1 SRPBCC domain-containing protein [Chryseobacterium nematophagum]
MDPIIVEYKINVPVQRIWKALTDSNEMKKWYFDISDFDLKVGKIFNFYEPGEAKKYHHQAEILEIIPQHILKHSWMYPEFSKSKTIVTWELLPQGDETLVKLTHEGVDQFKELGENFSKESFTDGWNEILGQSLKPYLEK